ncbi:endonuclease domain-containing protein [Pedobacter sp. SL55]|uniref:endonuclease domain-containing protein n=1 Tax=Pedobacter sp. SL55 TaxID=2995161 RepID=UPI00226FFD2C|nr:endonuclease domain-containing protein [Pedobacter sp. SL55]WAC39685.1 endonuclease domain-containing protein [Pedobacter sp. SL55]
MTYKELDDEDYDMLWLKEPSMFYGASNLIFDNAKRLRNTLTDSEALLWNHLKGKQLGFKFRRQHPIAYYIADFYCHEAKLVIELDGSIHNQPDILQNDIERQKYLERLGLTVLRFTNDELYNNTNKVLEEINKIIQAQRLTASPLGGGGIIKTYYPLLRCKRRSHG